MAVKEIKDMRADQPWTLIGDIKDGDIKSRLEAFS